jgi:hypothetical protein
MTGLLGTGPERCRSARPRVDTRGRGVCSPATKRNAQPVLQTPLRALRAPASSARTDPHEPLAAKALATPGGPLRASLRLIPLLLRGHTGRDDEGRG